MAVEIVMPRLSDSMEEGVVLEWRKSVGDEVAVGDALVEIETDKANMTYDADVAGTLLEILVEAGDSAALGAPSARIGKSGEALPGAAGAAAEPVAAAAVAEAAPTAATDAVRNGGGSRAKASPLARRIAAAAGLELTEVAGSGPRGRIVRADVEAALASGSAPAAGSSSQAALPDPEPTPSREHAPARADREDSPKGAVEVVELTRLQQTVARRMSESKATVPHFYLTAEIDMTRCVEARAATKASAVEGEVVPSLNDMVVKACGLVLRQLPKANGSYRDGHLELHSRVNVGVAVASGDALVVPTIFDADRKGLREIAADARALAGRVRDGSITPPELAGGTFTVSNLGMLGVSSFAAVVNPPQAAILGVGALVQRPIVVGGDFVPAHLMQVTLACDHRILYGADGAEFLAKLRGVLEHPLRLAG
ncbi:MAG: dihydrolipoamide acetyltransferase family protein [Thermoleophilaceae bacterium]